MKRALALLPLIALAACGDPGDSPDGAPEAPKVPKAITQSAVAAAPVESQFGTPVKDRVATLGLLNKRNNLTQDVVLKTGEAKRIGNVVIKLSTCERTLPWEKPEEEGAFVQVVTYDRANANESMKWRTVFSGWLFKNSPSLNVVEHPVYDVWVKNCAMKFPGEEAPAPSATPSSAAKPEGTSDDKPSPKPSPKPSASPSPRPTASASPKPSPKPSE